MAGFLGINVNTYYHYERTGKIPRPVSIAARFLSTQTQISEKPTARPREIAKFRARFLPGARFGTLLVVRHSPSPEGSKRPHVLVRCDCGREMDLSIHALERMTQCGPACIAGHPPILNAHSPTPGEEDDLLDIDATPEERHAYNLRKFKEQIAAEKAAAAAIPAEEEWEAGL